jgi:ubiquinone/menaquinone biosynthesis C-methylase UbiE
MFSDPKNNIKQLHLTEGMSVADFGSGSGHYVMAASELVGDRGRVYAIDLQQSLLQKVKRMVEDAKRENVDVLWGDIERIEGTKLDNESVDSVIVANTLFQVEDKDTLIIEIRRVLKNGGKLMVVDWSDSFGGIGPQASDIVTESAARNIFIDKGFKFDNRFDAGEHHYGLIFHKNNN